MGWRMAVRPAVVLMVLLMQDGGRQVAASVVARDGRVGFSASVAAMEAEGLGGSRRALLDASNVTQLGKYVVVAAGESINGRGRRYTSPRQKTEGASLIVIEDGGTLSNFVLAEGSGPGVTCKGSCTLNNVNFEATDDVAIRISNEAPVGSKITVSGGGVREARGKAIVIEAPVEMEIDGFEWYHFGVGLFACERCKTEQGPISVIVSNCRGIFATYSEFLAQATGGRNSVLFAGLGVFPPSAAKVCSGPEGFCNLSNVTTINGQPLPASPTTPEVTEEGGGNYQPQEDTIAGERVGFSASVAAAVEEMLGGL